MNVHTSVQQSTCLSIHASVYPPSYQFKEFNFNLHPFQQPTMLLDLLILLVTVWLTHFLIHEMRKPKNFPNGPIFYPIIGNLLTVAKLRKETGFLIRAVMKIAEQYSNTKDVIGLKIGKDLVVFTMTTKALKEVYTCSDFDGRPFGPFYETRTWNKRRGIIFTDQGM